LQEQRALCTFRPAALYSADYQAWSEGGEYAQATGIDSSELRSVRELNADGRPTKSGVLTVAQLCDHFEQRELSKDNTWRSHATKKIYQAYLSRWIFPPLQGDRLRPIEDALQRSSTPAGQMLGQGSYQTLDRFIRDQTDAHEKRVLQARGEKMDALASAIDELHFDLSKIMLTELPGQTLETN
jgi:hypothetical protein